MKRFLIVLTLWSCAAFPAYAVRNPFTLVRGDYSVEGKPIEVKNMPRVRSQDSVPDCWGFAAATIAQRYICDVKKTNPCNPPPEKEISPFSMVAWTHTNSDNGGVAEVRNHKNIQLGKEGSAAVNALQNAKDSFIFMAESCFPHDQFAVKYGRSSENEKKIETMFRTIEQEYSKYKTEAGFCEDCLKGAVSGLNIQMSIDDLKKAMDSKSTAGEFLHRITLGKCGDVVDAEPLPGFEMFPQKKEDVSYGSMINKIKQVLSQDYPLSLDDVCLSYENGKCTGSHSLVISGYRKMCKGSGECRDVVRVHNSWGEDWQKQNDDGWVDAKELLATSISKNSLAWYHKNRAISLLIPQGSSQSVLHVKQTDLSHDGN